MNRATMLLRAGLLIILLAVSGAQAAVPIIHNLEKSHPSGDPPFPPPPKP